MNSRKLLYILILISTITFLYPIYGRHETSVGDTLIISKTSAPPIIDGDLDEVWSQVTKVPNLTYVVGQETNDASDASFLFMTLWDDQNFYLFAEVLDNEINVNNNDTWQRDGFEIYFDGDNSKGKNYDGIDDQQYRWVYGESSGNPGTDNSVHAFKKTDHGFNFELVIPMNDLHFIFKDNLIIGFDLQYNDNDGGSRQHVAKWWSSSDNNYLDPSLFGTAKFVGGEPEPELEQTKKPNFSYERGFYNEPIDVELTSKTPNATIRYTLDGSDPVNSATALTSLSPVIVHIDPESTTGGRGKYPGVTLRACASADSFSTSESETHTYLFINKVTTLSPEGVKPGPGWPDPGSLESYNYQFMDYGMAQDVLFDSRYKDFIDDALTAIPTISLTTDLKNLFNRSTGIYVNATQDGPAWERPASIELLNPDGSDGFQINCGIRIRGGWSRNDPNPKHAFRLFFKEEYGKSKLTYKLFGDKGVDEFDKLDLRTSQNYSWSFKDYSGKFNVMTRDVFSRDLQGVMGQPYTRSRFYHLYIDGVYWGLFQSQERSEAKYAESYFGGNSDDYDVIKPDSQNHNMEATDGNMTAYTEIWNMCNSGFSTNSKYYKLLGKNEDGTRNSSYKVLVDIDNLIDFMLVIFYTGNFDSPTSKFGGENMPNNFFCIYNRNNNDEGFKFFAHDAEHSLLTFPAEIGGEGVYENRVSINMTVGGLYGFHPQWLHYKLTSNAEYKLKFADHVYKHFFNNGCMTPSKAAELFESRVKEIEMAIIGESARWGNTYWNTSRTKDDDWQWAVDDIMNNYFPLRTNIVLNQLKSAKLYPTIDPPQFINSAQQALTGFINVEPGYKIKLHNPNNAKGTIYYTISGDDPRLIGGNVTSVALDGSDEIELTINSTTIIKTRVQDGTTWSAVNELTIFSNNSTSSLKVTELHYHPLDGETLSDNEYEFLEMKNIGTEPINLSNAFFGDGIEYTFPAGTSINPNEFFVLASNKLEFNNRYGFLPFDEFLGQLDNGGEKISLVTALNDTVFSIRYNDKDPWPESPDTAGYSLVPKDINPIGDQNDPLNWRASLSVGGSPGRDDIPTGIETKPDELPTSFKLEQNYPNPFNPSTVIGYHLPVSGYVSLKIYDMLGREVATLVDKFQNAGSYKVTFSTQRTTEHGQLTSGVYFYRLQSVEGIVTKKMITLK